MDWFSARGLHLPRLFKLVYIFIRRHHRFRTCSSVYGIRITDIKSCSSARDWLIIRWLCDRTWARGEKTVEGLRRPTLVGKKEWYTKLAEVFSKRGCWALGIELVGILDW